MNDPSMRIRTIEASVAQTRNDCYSACRYDWKR